MSMAPFSMYGDVSRWGAKLGAPPQVFQQKNCYIYYIDFIMNNLSSFYHNNLKQ